jgi:hypothetical protein
MGSASTETCTMTLYTATGHAKRASICSWKAALPWLCSSVFRATLDFQLTPFSDQHWTQSTHHGVGAELGFPCWVLKGDLWRTIDTECVNGCEWKEQWVCLTDS